MANSLKDALKQAGFKHSKQENERKKLKPKETTEAVRHQLTRNHCEVCDLMMPDVEQYKHKNPTVSGEWICLRCADKNSISDDFRMTAQSELSKKGMFKRFFGHTRPFSQGKPLPVTSRPYNKQHPNNRADQHQRNHHDHHDHHDHQNKGPNTKRPTKKV